MNSEANDMILKIEKLIDRKKTGLESIYRLTLEQKKDIEENAGDNLKKLLDQKQKCIDSIDGIDEEFDKGFRSLKEILNINNIDLIDVKLYPGIRIIKSKVLAVMELVKKVLELEAENEKNINKLLIGIKEELEKTKLGQKSLNAYENKGVNTEGIYIDKKK